MLGLNSQVTAFSIHPQTPCHDVGMNVVLGQYKTQYWQQTTTSTICAVVCLVLMYALLNLPPQLLLDSQLRIF